MNWVEYSPDINTLKVHKDRIGIMGQNLHSLVNFAAQPIVYRGKFAGNCELYNWKEVDTKYAMNAENDADLLIKLIECNIDNFEQSNGKVASSDMVYKLIEKTLDEFSGVYSFAYWLNEYVYVFRDIIGVKPLWYSYDTSYGFAFSSERKALSINFCSDSKELDPRIALCYDITQNKIHHYKRKSLSIYPPHSNRYDEMRSKLEILVEKSIKERLPETPFGILFSGGVDSAILAYMCVRIGKIPGRDFFCYSAGLLDKKSAHDVRYSKIVAKKLNLELRINEVPLEETESMLKTVIRLVEDTEVPKVGVGLTMFAACLAAREDGVRIMLSGSGADELLAGYNRHKSSDNANEQCYMDIMDIYQRNTYRDDVVSMHNGIELRFPYLALEVVDFCLKVPAKYKIQNETNKMILRDIGKKIGISEDISMRRKKAAQYGSGFDRAINKLSKSNGFKTKTDYLKDIQEVQNYRLGVLFSSGKDSNYSLYLMQKQKYPIECLITIRSKNPHSYMFHTPNIDMVHLQSQAIGIPLIEKVTEGEKEIELEDLKEALEAAIRQYGINGVVTGALYSTYQKDRIEKICSELGLKVFSPLWHTDQEQEMRDILNEGFEFIFSSIAAYGLDRSWLGRRIEEKDIDDLVDLNERIGVNIAGEGGEFESFVTDGPIYEKKIEILDYDVDEMDENTARIIIRDARLIDKDGSEKM